MQNFCCCVFRQLDFSQAEAFFEDTHHYFFLLGDMNINLLEWSSVSERYYKVVPMDAITKLITTLV